MVREGYKMTELGEIPEDWEVNPLEKVSKIIMGQSPNSDSYNDDGEGLPFFQGKTEFGTVYPKIKKWCSEPTKVAEPNDILISVRAPVGDINKNNISACIGRGLAAISNNDYSDSDFLYYTLKTKKRYLEKQGQGSTFTAINSNDLKSLLIQLPKLKEQKKIADILSTGDEQLEQTDQLIEKTKELKKGLMQKLLSKGIGHTEFKQTELGEIPVEWEIKYIGEIADIRTGKKDTKDRIESGEYPFFVRSQVIERINSYSFEGEAVLTAGDGVGVGKVFHYINGKFDYHQRVYKVSDFHNVDGKYFYYYFMKNFLKQAMKYNAKTSVDSVRMEMITKMMIPVPSLKEQKKIAKILSAIDDQIEEYSSKKEKLELLKKGLMQQLLTGKIRVKEVT